MDDDSVIKNCRCLGFKHETSGRRFKRCMGPRANIADGNVSGVATKSPNGPKKFVLARGRAEVNRLPLLSSPQTDARATRPQNPFPHLCSKDTSSTSSVNSRRHTRARRRRAPRGNHLYYSSNKIECGTTSESTATQRQRPLRVVAPFPSLLGISGASIEEGDIASEYLSCLSDDSDIYSGSSVASFRSAVDSLGSANSMNSLGALPLMADAFPLEDGSAAEGSTLATHGRTIRLGVVGKTLFDSWKELPWQARLCPAAIELQENARRATALEMEGHRVREWRQQQQTLASKAAREEERILLHWWKKETEQLWRLRSHRRKSHQQLAVRHEAQLIELENQRRELLGVEYGQELAALDMMDELEQVERLRQVELLFASFSFGADTNRAGTSGAPALAVADSHGAAQSPGTIEGRQPVSPDGEDDRVARLAVRAQLELERVKLPASAAVARAEVFFRRRQSLAYLVCRGLKAVYCGDRDRARRTFVSECAADVALVMRLASGERAFLPSGGGVDCGGVGVGGNAADAGNDEVDPDTVAWKRERLRVSAEIECEAGRVDRWARLQREVLRRSTEEVVRLLTVESRRQPPSLGGRWPLDRQEQGAGAGDVSQPEEAVRRRARAALKELRRRQVEASLEAESVQRSWMAALAHWKTQLRRARVTAAKAETAELRILQKEDEEAAVALEDEATRSLARRSEALIRSWEVVFEAERVRIGDAAGSWRHCFLAACERLEELVERARREKLRVAENWTNENGTALGRSQELADLIDAQEERLEDEQLSLVTLLAKIVAANAAAETEAAAAARRDWWAEAGESLPRLLSARIAEAAIRGGGGSGGEILEGEPPTRTDSDGACDSVQLVARLERMIRVEELRAAQAAADAVADHGPLYRAVAEKRLRCREEVERCESVFEAACDRSRAESSSAGAAALASASASTASPAPVGEGYPVLQLGEHNLFRSKLGLDAVLLAAASFEDDVRQVALEAAAVAGSRSVAIEEVTASPGDSPGELTRSELDLRRAARIGVCARGLSDTVSRACKVLHREMLETRAADEENFLRQLSVATSHHLHRLGHLKTQARVETDEALAASVAEVEKRAKDASAGSHAAKGIRRRVVGLVMGLVDQAVQSERERSERRRCGRRDRSACWAASLAEHKELVFQEQQEWIRLVRERRREATEGARVAVADRVAELIHQRRQRRREEAGTGLTATRDSKRASKSSLGDEVPAALDGYASGASGENGENGEISLTGGNCGEAKGVFAVEDAAGCGSSSSTRGDVDGEANLQPPEKTGDVVVAAAASSCLGELFEAEVLSGQAAAGASCAVGVDAWAEELQSRARAWAGTLIAEAASDEVEERDTTEGEGKAVESALRDVQKEVEEAISESSSWASLPSVKQQEGGNSFEARRSGVLSQNAEGTLGEAAKGDPLPDFITEEGTECARLLSRLERSLSERLRVASERAGKGRREEAERVGAEATAHATDLEAVLRGVLVESTASCQREVRAMIAAGEEEVRSAFELIEEEENTIAVEEENAADAATVDAAAAAAAVEVAVHVVDSRLEGGDEGGSVSAV